MASSDATGLLAFPLTTLRRDRKRDSDLDQLEKLLLEYGAVGVIVGMPTTLAGRHGPSAQMATRYGEQLAGRIAPLPVRYWDERLSTVTASRILRDHGLRGAAARAVIDQIAAVQILQTWLDSQLQSKQLDAHQPHRDQPDPKL